MKSFLKQPGYGFLVESTMIETAKFQANIMTNWKYHKEQSFTSNHFFFEDFLSV